MMQNNKFNKVYICQICLYRLYAHHRHHNRHQKRQRHNIIVFNQKPKNSIQFQRTSKFPKQPQTQNTKYN